MCNHTILHTGQNYEPELDSIFFEGMGIRRPDIHLDTRSSTPMGQVSRILEGAEAAIASVRPDACLILGDTNSGLSAIVAEKMGVSVFHMEAGNRCFDLRVPEERNRKLIDHVSTWLLPYVENSKANLLNEGINKEKIMVSGNPIYEVLQHYAPQINASQVFDRLGVEPGRYFLVTAHRAENVDIPERLVQIVESLNRIANQYGMPVIWSCHPRTESKLKGLPIDLHPRVMKLRPLNLFDFVKLEKHAYCVITDSGTVQEEACIFHVPSVTIRDTTERPETVHCGSNILTGVDPARVLKAVEHCTTHRLQWQVPVEYLDPCVSEKVVRFILTNTSPR